MVRTPRAAPSSRGWTGQKATRSRSGLLLPVIRGRLPRCASVEGCDGADASRRAFAGGRGRVGHSKTSSSDVDSPRLLLIALVKETKEEALFGHFQDPKTIDAFPLLMQDPIVEDLTGAPS